MEKSTMCFLLFALLQLASSQDFPLRFEMPKAPKVKAVLGNIKDKADNLKSLASLDGDVAESILSNIGDIADVASEDVDCDDFWSFGVQIRDYLKEVFSVVLKKTMKDLLKGSKCFTKVVPKAFAG